MSGPLKNERLERFAQTLAKGEKQHEAYLASGYHGNAAAACKAAARADVRARVSELQERIAARTEITVASVTDRLLKIAEKAEDDKMGSPGLAVARAALMDAAKLNGLVPERHELTGKNGGPIEYRNLDEAEIDARLDALMNRNAGRDSQLAH